MGLLSTLGTPLPWDKAKHFAEHVRRHGITQFLSTWDRLKDRYGDELMWGDEVLRLACLHLLATHFPPAVDRVHGGAAQHRR